MHGVHRKNIKIITKMDQELTKLEELLVRLTSEEFFDKSIHVHLLGFNHRISSGLLAGAIAEEIKNRVKEFKAFGVIISEEEPKE